MADCEEIGAGQGQKKGKGKERNWKDEDIEMLITLYEERPCLWNSKERNVLPVVKNLKVRASLSEGDIGDRILVFLLTILGLITSTRRRKELTSIRI